MLHDVTNYLISVVIFVLKHAKSMLDVVFVVFVVGFERFEAPDSRRSQDVGANRYLGFWGLYFSEQSCQSSHAESIQFVTWKSPETAFFGDSFSMSWIMNWLWVGSYWCWDRHPLSPLSPWLRFSHVLIDRSCGSDPCLGQQHHGDGDYPWWIRGTVHHHFSEQHLHPMCHLEEVHGSTRVWIFGMNRPFELWWYCHV